MQDDYAEKSISWGRERACAQDFSGAQKDSAHADTMCV